jgi:hypothetical protein
MAERVVPWDPGFEWEPNDPEAVLAVSDGGQAALALNAHFDDADQDCVVFVWSGTRLPLRGLPTTKPDPVIAYTVAGSPACCGQAWSSRASGSRTSNAVTASTCTTTPPATPG